MDSLFIIPALISPNINPKLVPALCKVVERNILLNNSAVIYSAVMTKQNNAFRRGLYGLPLIGGLIRDDYNRFIDNPNKILQEDDKIIPGMDLGPDLDKTITGDVGRSPERGETLGHSITTPETIELPQGISFFHNISLEPTFLRFPMRVKASFPMSSAASARWVLVGMKCVPYKLVDIPKVMDLLKNIRSYDLISRFVFRHKNQILNKISFFSKRWWSYKGEKSGEAVDILFSPSSYQLANKTYLSWLMSEKKAKSWSTMAMLSTDDFQGNDLRDNILAYRRLVQAGWNDMVIVNHPQESVNFCVSKMRSCYELPFAYMKQILNLSNVLDYSEVSRWTKPFHVATVGKALGECATDNLSEMEVFSKIMNIIV